MTTSQQIGITLLLVMLLCGISGCTENHKNKNHKDKNHNDYQIWGIDISRHQASVDWSKMLDDTPPHFVFLKATEGTLIIDPTYQKRSDELTKRGIIWGAYHFFGHRTSGKEQAKTFIRNTNLSQGNLLPVLDIEKHRFMTDPKHMVRQVKAFCREIKRYYGVEPIIYCSTLFYEKYLEKEFSTKKYILWIADYRGNPDHLNWHFWQHTENHQIKGISGSVDRNVFGGNSEQLQMLLLK